MSHEGATPVAPVGPGSPNTWRAFSVASPVALARYLRNDLHIFVGTFPQIVGNLHLDQIHPSLFISRPYLPNLTARVDSGPASNPRSPQIRLAMVYLPITVCATCFDDYTLCLSAPPLCAQTERLSNMMDSLPLQGTQARSLPW